MDSDIERWRQFSAVLHARLAGRFQRGYFGNADLGQRTLLSPTSSSFMFVPAPDSSLSASTTSQMATEPVGSESGRVGPQSGAVTVDSHGDAVAAASQMGDQLSHSSHSLTASSAIYDRESLDDVPMAHPVPRSSLSSLGEAAMSITCAPGGSDIRPALAPLPVVSAVTTSSSALAESDEEFSDGDAEDDVDMATAAAAAAAPGAAPLYLPRLSSPPYVSGGGGGPTTRAYHYVGPSQLRTAAAGATVASLLLNQQRVPQWSTMPAAAAAAAVPGRGPFPPAPSSPYSLASSGADIALMAPNPLTLALHRPDISSAAQFPTVMPLGVSVPRPGTAMVQPHADPLRMDTSAMWLEITRMREEQEAASNALLDSILLRAMQLAYRGDIEGGKRLMEAITPDESELAAPLFEHKAGEALPTQLDQISTRNLLLGDYPQLPQHARQPVASAPLLPPAPAPPPPPPLPPLLPSSSLPILPTVPLPTSRALAAATATAAVVDVGTIEEGDDYDRDLSPPAKKFICESCDKAFAYRASLVRHARQKHPDSAAAGLPTSPDA